MVKEQSKSQNAVDLYDPTREKGIPNKKTDSANYAQSGAHFQSFVPAHTKTGQPADCPVFCYTVDFALNKELSFTE